MKRSHLLILLAFLLCNPGYPQQKFSGRVEYAVQIDLESGLTKPGSSKQTGMFLNQISKASESITLELEFDQKGSVFRPTNAVRPDNVPAPFYRSAERIACRGSYFYNLEEKELLQEIEKGKETYLVMWDKSEHDWKLSKEQKRIGQYNCYKASTTKTVRGKDHEITAWYSPDIAVPYGPLEYHGLPGLILELDYGESIRYIAKRVILGNKISVEFPREGIFITKREYEEQALKLAQNFRESISN